eukprot:CAMPEP_0117543116 /NCGR_PEP_ID=MMETSP0784-20121206/44893_1 /TAXON_ID=39447 /ORGANISM="" /LENGTH=335 /DNA_ID=CAMNT_0005339881 /DNA_START=102 /DNA_END=1113 /DNA_ORIENTATION=-
MTASASNPGGTGEPLSVCPSLPSAAIELPLRSPQLCHVLEENDNRHRAIELVRNALGLVDSAKAGRDDLQLFGGHVGGQVIDPEPDEVGPSGIVFSRAVFAAAAPISLSLGFGTAAIAALQAERAFAASVMFVAAAPLSAWMQVVKACVVAGCLVDASFRNAETFRGTSFVGAATPSPGAASCSVHTLGLLSAHNIFSRRPLATGGDAFGLAAAGPDARIASPRPGDGVKLALACVAGEFADPTARMRMGLPAAPESLAEQHGVVQLCSGFSHDCIEEVNESVIQGGPARIDEVDFDDGAIFREVICDNLFRGLRRQAADPNAAILGQLPHVVSS